MQMRLEYVEHFAESLLQGERREARIREDKERKASEATKRSEGHGHDSPPMPLKSSLKRSPSTGDKHVSFSTEPPQIEHIESPTLSDWETQKAMDSATENNDFSSGSELERDGMFLGQGYEDSSLYGSQEEQEQLSDQPLDYSENIRAGCGGTAVAHGSSNRDRGHHASSTLDTEPGNSDQPSDSPQDQYSNAVVLFRENPKMPQLKAGRDFTLSVRRLPINASEGAGSAHGEMLSTTSVPATSRPIAQKVEPVSKVVDQDETAKSTKDSKNNDNNNKPITDSTDLTFDLLMDGNDDNNGEYFDAEDEDTSTSVGEEELGESVSSAGQVYTHSSLVSGVRNHAPSLPDAQSSVVGSAPIDIQMHDIVKRGLCSDGGPRPTAGSLALLDEVDEAALDTEPKFKLSYQEMDPANMSFGQRMMWESHKF